MIRTRFREDQSKDSDFLSEEEGSERFIFREDQGTNDTNLILDGYIKLEDKTVTLPSGTDLIIHNTAGALYVLDSSGADLKLPSGWNTLTKAATYTMLNRDEIMANTSGGGFTLNLPSSPSVGDRVRIYDSHSSFSSYNLIIGRSSSLIEGAAEDLTLQNNNDDREFVYTGATRGWAWRSSRNYLG